MDAARLFPKPRVASSSLAGGTRKSSPGRLGHNYFNQLLDILNDRFDMVVDRATLGTELGPSGGQELGLRLPPAADHHQPRASRPQEGPFRKTGKLSQRGVAEASHRPGGWGGIEPNPA